MLELGWAEVEKAWQAVFGTQAPTWLLPAVVILALGSATGLLRLFSDAVKWFYKVISGFTRRFVYNQDTKDFIQVRGRFAKHLISEVERLNRETDWSDFYYVALEAEVEADPALDIESGHTTPLTRLWRFLGRLPRALLRITPSPRVEKNLVHAIQRSKSQAFLVIGDPGTGKTVSLRHLFLNMTEECASSNAKEAIIPIYLNLKRFTTELSPNDGVATVPHHTQLANLRRDLEAGLSDQEFRTICAEVNVDYDDLPTAGRAYKMRELVTYLDRRGRIDELIQACRRLRPDVLWQDIGNMTQPSARLTADKVREWILKELAHDQDRSVHEFLARNFESILNRGQFFFIFDSFDEIPAVMDAVEETEIVQSYAQALDRFLHGTHGCRGLVSSRPYRAPRTFLGQKLMIRPLPNRRIKEALEKYLYQQRALLEQLWHQLVYERDDLLYIARNPFYLGLLARYVKDNTKLPMRQYDLFENFIQSRASSDEKRLHTFGLTADELINRTSVLAYAMTQAPEIGLEAEQSQLLPVLNEYVPSVSWGDTEQVKSLLNGLAYSKLGRVSRTGSVADSTFSFVHRRFHEYLTARYIRSNLQTAPLTSVAEDNRWREILVLLAEVLPTEQLKDILAISQTAIEIGLQSVPGTPEQRKGIEALRFLRDGFRSRMDDVPDDLRQICASFITKQFTDGNLLDQKRAVESTAVADDDSAPRILEIAFNSHSDWIRDVSLRACRNIRRSSEKLEATIRSYLFEQYTTLRFLRNVESYKAVLSASSSLSTINNFVNLLYLASILQITVLLGLAGYAAYSIVIDGQVRPVLLFPVALFTAFYVTGLRLFGEEGKPLRFFSYIWSRLLLVAVVLWILASILFSQVLDWNSAFLRVLGLDCLVVGLLWLTNHGLEILATDFPTKAGNWLTLPAKIFLPPVSRFANKQFEKWKSFKSELTTENILGTLLGCGVLFVFGMICLVISGLINSVRASLPNTTTDQILQLERMGQGLFLGVSTVIIVVSFLLAVLTPALISILLRIFNLANDQILLTRLSTNPHRRPHDEEEVVQKLHDFKTADGKTRYLRAVQTWLPSGMDTEIILAEAAKSEHDSATRDALYQLAEIWEDSNPTSTLSA